MASPWYIQYESIHKDLGIPKVKKEVEDSRNKGELKL